MGRRHLLIKFKRRYQIQTRTMVPSFWGTMICFEIDAQIELELDQACFDILSGQIRTTAETLYSSSVYHTSTLPRPRYSTGVIVIGIR